MNKISQTGLCVFLMICLALSHAFAQRTQPFQYAVKFICGKPPAEILATGIYRTAINIHNPGDTVVAFRHKFARTLVGQKPGPVSQWRKARLGPDQAMEIDCSDSLNWFGVSPTFVKGFVILESDLVLDIVAVYTAAGSDGQVRTMAVERVTPRSLEARCPDLVIETIEKPIWDSTNKRSIIRAVVRNIGSATAGASIARVIDPTTFQPTGAPYNAIADTPVLDPGASATVVFYLPYWVYNPDVTLEITADYKGMVSECNEDNNMKVLKDIG